MKKGKPMTRGAGWTLTSKRGSAPFKGTLLRTFNLGHRRIAIFSVPKRFGSP